MNVTTAREWVRSHCNDALDSSRYSDELVDQAIQYVGNLFCRLTRCLRAAENVAIAAASTNFPIITPTANGFLPERIIDVSIASKGIVLNIIDYAELIVAAHEDKTTGVPTALAFKATDAAEVWPTPDAAYTAVLRYWRPFTSWAPGTPQDGTTLNLPDEYLPTILIDGAASVLRFPNPKDQTASASWRRFMDFTDAMRGAGSMGTKVIYRSPVET